MSLEFCRKGYNSADIKKAATQEEHISYVINSDLQETNLTSEYLKQWAERHYQTTDHFLNFVKSIFKEKNFLLFCKFLRTPLPSAKIVNTNVKPQLERVFFAEDAETVYSISGAKEAEYLPALNADNFNEELFQAYFIKHNSIVITEPTNIPNTPIRYLIDIKDVVSIEENKRSGKINRIAFKQSIELDGKMEKGTMYIDSEMYAFYPEDKKVAAQQVPHDLKTCPAHFISTKRYKGNFVIRESLFTFIREELESYNILTTLMKMVMPNGVIPITKMLDVGANVKSKINDPKIEDIEGGQQPELYATNPPTGSNLLAAGTVHLIPPIDKDTGGFDMEVVKNFILFDYLPVEPLKFLAEEIEKKERAIISSLVGDLVESNDEAKNMLQVERSNAVLDNTLSSLAKTISKVRIASDTDMLSIKYQRERIQTVFVNMGTDFMIDSISQLLQSLKLSPNPIERENILRRINQNRYKNNPYQSVRMKLLYDLIPFVADIDFQAAKEAGILDRLTMTKQIQFNYYISKFENEYGDIVEFYKSNENDSRNIELISNLIDIMIETDINNKKAKEDESNSLTNQSGSVAQSGE